MRDVWLLRPMKRGRGAGAEGGGIGGGGRGAGGAPIANLPTGLWLLLVVHDRRLSLLTAF
jgi:hypothetical protein